MNIGHEKLLSNVDTNILKIVFNAENVSVQRRHRPNPQKHPKDFDLGN